MKTMKSICWSVIITAGLMAGAQGEQFRTDINPALRYYQALILVGDLPQGDRDYLSTNDWRGQKLPERFGQLVTGYDKQFKLVRQAGHATVPCDWGIDMSEGPATLLPHLARLKTIAQTARLRAMWALQNGRAREACDDLLAALALGRNASRDGTLIAALVQIAIENIVCSTVAENFGRFPPEILKQWADGMDAVPTRGTMAACMTTERACFTDWLANKILELQKEHPGNDAKVMAALHDVFAGVGDSDQAKTDLWGQVSKAAGGSSEGVLKLVRDEVPFYDRLTVIMALPQAEFEEQAKVFSAEMQKSSNPLPALTMPAVAKARQKEFAAQVTLAMMRAAVEYKLHGEEGLQSVTDPCGKGPFELQKFVFDGVERGFELKSAYAGRGFPEAFIFVEKDGPPFHVAGAKAGQPVAH